MSWLLVLGLVGSPFAACGPDAKPERLCDGPTFNLTLRAEPGPLPEDTRINVRYGGNQEGEPYELGQDKPGQSVFCDEQLGGASGVSGEEGTAGAGGAAPSSVREEGRIAVLSCRLFTQGPARLDATASGYEPVVDEALLLEGKRRCEVPVEVVLIPSAPDAGAD